MESQTALKLFVIIGVAGLLLLGNGIVSTDIGNLFSGVAFCQPEEEEEPVQARPRPDVMPYQGQQGPLGARIIGDSGKPKMIGDTGKPTAAPAPIPMPPQPDPEDSRTGIIGDTGKPSAKDDGNHGDGMTTMQPALGTQTMQPATPQHNPNWKENTSIPR